MSFRINTNSKKCRSFDGDGGGESGGGNRFAKFQIGCTFFTQIFLSCNSYDICLCRLIKKDVLPTCARSHVCLDKKKMLV